MQQTAGESPHQRLLSRALPRDLVDEAYALVPRRGDFTSRLEQQEATITYLSVLLGDGQPVTFYFPPGRYFPGSVRVNCSLGECTGLPWIVDRFYVRGLDRDYRKNRQIRRALDDINRRTQWLDDHSDIEDHPDDVQAPDPAAGPSA
jgi:hypothetical protein